MEVLRFETPGIAHYAYLICAGKEAAVVDPRRDVDDYLDAAEACGARVRYVLETHRQEDFVMGSAHLAERTGATIVNGQHELFGHGDLRLGDGESVSVGGLRLQALHTPGHTPESTCYALFSGEGKAPWGVFTGDSLFYGSTGRTDLTDRARTAENARVLYESVHEKLAPLGDEVLVFPAHGPGSVCGSGMASLPSSTLGAEKRYNEVFTLDRDAFADKKQAERMPRPPYFRHMESVNLDGGLPPPSYERLPLLGSRELAESVRSGLLIDTREPEAFAGGHVPRAVSIWRDGLPAFGGWVARPDTPIFLITDRHEDIRHAFWHLVRIGIDNLKGALAGGFGTWRTSGEPITHLSVTTPRELAQQREGTLLDVREVSEFEAGHVPGARHAYVGDLESRIEGLGLNPERPVTVTCGAGPRSSLAASLLKRRGFGEVRNLLGGMTAWRALELPLELGSGA